MLGKRILSFALLAGLAGLVAGCNEPGVYGGYPVVATPVYGGAYYGGYGGTYYRRPYYAGGYAYRHGVYARGGAYRYGAYHGGAYRGHYHGGYRGGGAHVRVHRG